MDVENKKNRLPWVTNYPWSGGPPPYIGCVSIVAPLCIFKEKPPDSNDESFSAGGPPPFLLRDFHTQYILEGDTWRVRFYLKMRAFVH